MTTREKIENLAPDQASLAAALKLVKPASWPVLASNADGSFLWGECQGSGSTPYRVVVTPEDTGYKCTCPSRKFPCKHVLAVLWLHVDKPKQFASTPAPQWVEEWSARRRPGASQSGRPPGKPKQDDQEPKPAPSLEAALAEPEEAAPADPKAVARAEAQRQRLKAEREAAILAGLDDLDRWLLDQIAHGMASFAPRCQEAVRTLSMRLVDAKAGGLAGRLDRLSGELFRVPETQRADVAIEQLASTALIASAYRNQHQLPEPLREDVRRAVGWTQKREEILADPTAPRVSTLWTVAANLTEVQPDKLRRTETWLVDTAPRNGRPKVAVLIDFVPVSGGAFGFPFEPGECIQGDVVFYPSAAPLRGLLAARRQTPATQAWPVGHCGITPALDEFNDRLAVLPWLDSWPLIADEVEIRTAGTGVAVLTDANGNTLPLDRTQVEALHPLLGMGAISALFTWSGRSARIIAAQTPIGRWHES